MGGDRRTLRHRVDELEKELDELRLLVVAVYLQGRLEKGIPAAKNPAVRARIEAVMARIEARERCPRSEWELLAEIHDLLDPDLAAGNSAVTDLSENTRNDVGPSSGLRPHGSS